MERSLVEDSQLLDVPSQDSAIAARTELGHYQPVFGVEPDKPCVLFFVHMLSRFVTDFGPVAECLAQADVHTVVLAPEAGEAEEARPETYDVKELAAALPADTELLPLPFNREHITLGSLIATALQTRRVLKRHPESIAFFWTAIPTLACGLPARFQGHSCVYLVTGLGSVLGGKALRARLMTRLLRPAFRYLFSHPQSRIIVHNEEDKQFLSRWLGVPPNRFAVTSGCGVDPIRFPFFERLPKRRTSVVFVPVRLLREKGVLDAVEASCILAARGVRHEMWLSSYLDRANPSALEKGTVEAAAIGGNARFLEFQRSLVPVYERCDIVCVPTKYAEGLPTALLEAAATGRPIVATDNVGCREFVRPGETGLLVPPGSPERLAEAIEKLIRDRGLADRMRRTAHKQFLATSTKDHMVQITVDVLRQLGLRLENGRHKAEALPGKIGSSSRV